MLVSISVLLLSKWASMALTLPPRAIQTGTIMPGSTQEDIGHLGIHSDLKTVDLTAKNNRVVRATENLEDNGNEVSTFNHFKESSISPTTLFIPENSTSIINLLEGTTALDQINVTELGRASIHNPLFPVTESSYSAYGVLFLSLVVFAVGIVGNLSVMCIVWHNYFMRSAWNCILASLAFWDFLVLCFCLPVVVFHELTNKRLLGDFSCKAVPYMEVCLSKALHTVCLHLSGGIITLMNA